MTKYTNHEMERMLAALEPLLDRRDVIGYAAARNARVLRGELSEYSGIRDGLVLKYGEPDLDGEGNPTGSVTLSPGSGEFPRFAEELERFARIEHEPAIFKLGYGEAVGQLSGRELLELDWMFEDEG